MFGAISASIAPPPPTVRNPYKSPGHGKDIEALRKSPFWFYMEEGEHNAEKTESRG